MRNGDVTKLLIGFTIAVIVLTIIVTIYGLKHRLLIM
jgi:hypothetical protein